MQQTHISQYDCMFYALKLVLISLTPVPFVSCLLVLFFIFFFFFSSRRRHTRCSRDWSSDVCSSDLGCRRRFSQDLRLANHHRNVIAVFIGVEIQSDMGILRNVPQLGFVSLAKNRSEERRVGKECRSGIRMLN